MNELLTSLPFYGIFILFGVIGYALTIRFTKSTSILSYIIAKPLGMLVFAYPIWLLTSTKVLKYNNQTTLLILFIIALIISIGSILYFNMRKRQKDPNFKLFTSKFLVKVLIVEAFSLIFFLGYLYIRAFNPTLESTEKFMDLHLLMSSGKTDYFPFFDGWWAAKSVNYYYYGFYLFSLLVRLSDVPYASGYNFALGLIFVLALLITFAIVYKLIKNVVFAIVGAGLLGLAGNWHYASCFFQNNGPELSSKCYYPKATRILDPSYTINEFPSYSFLLGDLHPHVMSIPFFLTNLYLLILIYQKKNINHTLMVAYLITIATAAMINFWDFATLGFLFALVFFRKVFLIIKKQPFIKKDKEKTSFIEYCKTLLWRHKYLIIWSIAFAISPFIIFQPFFSTFKSPVAGVGFAPTYIQAHTEISNTQYPSTFSFLFGIWGFYIIIGLCGVLLIPLLSKRTFKKISIAFIFFITALLLIIFTETFFFRDLFHVANPSYFRANTVFKFGYHAWMLLSITSGVILFVIWKYIGKIKSMIGGIIADMVYLTLFTAFAFCVFLYPVIGVSQAYGPSMPWNLDKKPQYTVDGSKYILERNAGDYHTIQWINENIKERTVILEAVGGSYTYYGRIGVYTGMGNPINWESHQWTWRFHYPNEIKSWRDTIGKSIETGYGEIAAVTADVKMIYENTDLDFTRELLKKHNVSYVYIGDQERTTYSAIQEEKFESLGNIVFASGASKLYKLY